MGPGRSEATERGSPVDDASRAADEIRGLDRFGVLLVVTLINVVVLGLVDLSEGFESTQAAVGALIVTTSVAMTIVLATRAAGAARRIRRMAGAFAVLGVGVTLIALVGQVLGDLAVDELGSTTPTTWLALSAVATYVVVRRLLQHREVGLATLYGSLSAYLLIGVSFSFAFQVIGAYQQTSFFGEVVPTTAYMYFSLVTLTTVGYGGLEAVTPLGQLVSTLEALLGQVYLVTVVAMIVGLLAQRRR